MTTPNPVDALEPCPFCGMRVPDDLADTLYPSGIYRRNDPRGFHHYVSMNQRKAGDQPCWAMHCTENMGGCGVRITGDSEAEARSRWNRRAVEASASALAAMPAASVEAAAWMHVDDPRRVISAMQKADAVKDGGASASSVASYTMPLIHRHEVAQQAGGVPAGFRELVEMCQKALAEELSAWDIDPPLHHVKEAHDACEAWLAAPTPPAVPTIKESLTVEPRVPLSEAQRERWLCLLCKSDTPGRHGFLDDRKTPCPSGIVTPKEPT